MSIPAEAFFLTPGFNGTLQQQIQQMVAEGILRGRFRPGEKLPSSRGLAEHLGVSRITVTLAYTELVSGDYLTARGRSGYYVSDTAPMQPGFEFEERPHRDTVDWERIVGRRFSRHELIARPVDWQSYAYPFIYGQADATLFDHQNWRQCALRALGKRDFEVLTADFYERDDPMLIEYIMRSILPRRGISARPEEILLTMGAQNALWLASEILLGQGSRAAVENPCYPGLRAILGQIGAEVLPVEVDADGLLPEAVPEGIEAIFTTPSHHCPTNATMPIGRRTALLERAGREDFLVIEDDYEFEMSFLKPAAPALKSLDREGRVIHVGSFSKSLFPGLRLGYLVASEAFIREARALRAAMLRHTPGHIQRTVAYFLSLGHYDALINRLNQAYKRRRTVMDEAIRTHGLEIAGQGAFGGSSFWMRAPAAVDTGLLAVDLRAKGVLIEPGRAFFAPGTAPRNYYRLAYSSISQNRIPEGIALIAEALRETGANQVA
ncbi:PLP-dependent aminotransferase family protein [Defluviimonas sp. WL0024]|uniref:PLP-dependent aminotransferase family protein n=2 Tax=Albidovulum TaxID=205889 RepID=A0ABT3IXC6_9RHOB|nr:MULTISPECIES: PLP-dependent aminotransferase family protein [Defluviimonas]MCU9846511.1 PLP-dependent aminotransferase family protein [Defluviimonas sp. WL0024]MCW3780090.1 PLP-dependent aminotransferase family protein [Defluviimonas salinarum]